MALFGDEIKFFPTTSPCLLLFRHTTSLPPLLGDSVLAVPSSGRPLSSGFCSNVSSPEKQYSPGSADQKLLPTTPSPSSPSFDFPLQQPQPPPPQLACVFFCLGYCPSLSPGCVPTEGRVRVCPQLYLQCLQHNLLNEPLLQDD